MKNCREIAAAAIKQAEAGLKKLKTPSVADAEVRLALLRFYVATDRKELAETAIKDLRRDYPSATLVLAAECAWLASPRGVSSGRMNTCS